MVGRTAHYSGHVQGVGFRFTAQRIAQRHAVAGYVRNLPDGRVEIVVEGEESAVERFLGEVAAEMSGNIRDVQMLSSPATNHFTAFEIRGF